MTTSLYNAYTNVTTIGDEVVVRVRDAETKEASYFKVPYQPRTFTVGSYDSNDGWHTLDGLPLASRRYPTMRKYHEGVRAAEVSGRTLYGVISPVRQFLAEYVDKKCGIPFESLRTVYLDIEVASEGGFAPPENPTQPILAITAMVWGHYYVWGCGNYINTREDVTYHQCDDEVGLLKSFVKWWTSDYPDIITGWNTHMYDVPYIINRIDMLKGEKLMKFKSDVLSPWRKITAKSAFVMNREEKVYEIQGMSVLDYLELLRKFSLVPRESFRLDAIAEEELGERKVAYDEYGSLQRLATENYQKFIDYNIHDVYLVHKLNTSAKSAAHLLDLAVMIGYGARVNFTDTFKQVRLWDAMMYFDLYDKKIAVPPNVRHDKTEGYSGGYVKEPIVGKHSWVVSFDVNSLYPSIMRQWNISPDRHLPVEWLREKLEGLLPTPGEWVTPEEDVYHDCTPRSWLTHVAPEDVPAVRWALQNLITYLDTLTSFMSSVRGDIVDEFFKPNDRLMDYVLDDIISKTDPYPWLRILSVAVTPNGQAFRTDSHGFLTEMLATLYDERVSAKKKETAAKKKAEKAGSPEEKDKLKQEAANWYLIQSTRKVNLNSCYGAIGNQHHRFFDVRQAEAVTMTGQAIIQYVAIMVNKFLNKEFGTDRDYCIASDTDSIYLTMAPVAENLKDGDVVGAVDRYCEKTLQPVIDAAFATISAAFNTQNNILAMKREAIAEHGVWTGKKRYLLWVHDNEGVRYDPPKLKVVGIESVRSSTPHYARIVIKKALEHFIRDDQDAFYALMDEAEEGFTTKSFVEIASPRSCNGMDKYPIQADGTFTSGTPIQVKASLVYNRHLADTQLTHKYPQIKNGEKIRFCPLKKQNPLRCAVIAAPNALPPEWKLDRFLDRMDQFETTVLNPLTKIVQYANWTIRPSVTFDF